MPEGIVDRLADVWEPILAIADAAGGAWPQRSRAACVALAGASVTREASLGVRPLTDLKMVFDGNDKMGTADILSKLHLLDEAPWSDLNGKPLDPAGWRGG